LFKNIFKIILRDLSRDKVYTSIGILGLAAGISISIIIITICFTFLNFDKIHKKGERLYQAYQNEYESGRSFVSSTMPYLLGESLKKDYPEIKNTATVMSDDKVMFVSGNVMAEQAGLFSESSLFDMFTFPVLASAKTGTDRIFPDNNSIAISETMAKKFFGGAANAIGKRLLINRRYIKEDVYISTVFKDIPNNTHLKFDYVLPVKSVLSKWSESLNNWGNLCAETYVELKPNTNLSLLNSKIEHYIAAKNELRGVTNKSELFLYKFQDGFLKPPGYTPKTNFLILFMIIAASILIIASINFINLATSRAEKRGKEIGLRKVIGAGRKSLILRFLGETYFLAFIAILLGILLAELFMPVLNNAFNSILVFRIPYDSLYFIISVIGLWLITGLISGLYPALYLSGLKPALIFRGSSAPGGKIYFRKVLLTVQFVFSALFVFLSIVMYNQIQFIAHADLGLRIKQVMEFPLTSEIVKHYNAFSNDLKRIPGVEVVTCSEFEPTYVTNSTSDPDWEGKPADLTDMFETVSVGDDFLKAFDIKLLKGNDFNAGDTTGNSFIINQKMEKIINQSHPGNIVGMGLNWNGINGQIIGVVKDFQTGSFNSKMRPLIIRKNSNSMNYGFIRFDAGKLKSIIASASSVFNKYENDYPFQYKFMDSEYIKREVDAAVFVSLFSLFAVVAVIISCLGLFGLTAFSIQQKRKEIGIRKVLGASVKSVTALLTKSLLWTILTSAVIALPAGYYLSGQLLQLFVYRTKIGAGTFMLTLGIVILFAVLTVIFQVIKAALANPVDSIKYE